MSLLARAEARWQQITPEVPPAALRLHRRLLTRQIGLVESGASLPPSLPAFDAEVVRARLFAGTPVLRDVEVPGVPVGRFTSEMLAFLDELAWGGAGESARKIAREIEAGRLDLPSLRAASLARDEPFAREVAAHAGVNLQVLWLATDLATAPLAHALEDAALESGDEPVREAAAAWNRGHCPACGNWPALAEFFSSERMHRCGFCGAAWRMGPRGCTFCGESGPRFRTIPVDKRRPGRRLEVCRRCGGYLKTIDVEQLTPFPLLAIEDLATSDLDGAALAHGFRRVGLAR